MKCQGTCSSDNECTGIVQQVRVSGHGFKEPFEFFYCETAIDVDRANGFLVEPFDDEPEEFVESQAREANSQRTEL